MIDCIRMGDVFRKKPVDRRMKSAENRRWWLFKAAVNEKGAVFTLRSDFSVTCDTSGNQPQHEEVTLDQLRENYFLDVANTHPDATVIWRAPQPTSPH